MGPAALGRENAASSVVEALQCRQNADMPITEVMVVTNDKRQLDKKTKTVMELPHLRTQIQKTYVKAVPTSALLECSAYCSTSPLLCQCWMGDSRVIGMCKRPMY